MPGVTPKKSARLVWPFFGMHSQLHFTGPSENKLLKNKVDDIALVNIVSTRSEHAHACDNLTYLAYCSEIVGPITEVNKSI